MAPRKFSKAQPTEDHTYPVTSFLAQLPPATHDVSHDTRPSYRERLKSLNDDMISLSKLGQYEQAEKIKLKIESLKVKVQKLEQLELLSVRKREEEEGDARREQVLSRLRSEFEYAANEILKDHDTKLQLLRLAAENERVHIIEEAERNISAGPRLTPELHSMMKNEKYFAKELSFTEALTERKRAVSTFKEIKANHEQEVRHHAMIQLHKVDKQLNRQIEVLKQNLISALEDLRIGIDRERLGMIRLSEVETRRTIERISDKLST